MSEITSKAALLDAIRGARAALEGALARFDEEALVTAAVTGDWTPKDIMAHISDWERRFLRWVEAGRRGEVVERPEPGITWAEEDWLNQMIFERHRSRSLNDVRAEFAAAYRAIYAAIAAMSEDELFAPGYYAWSGDEPLLAIVWGVTADHYAEHTAGLKAWLRAHGA